MGTSQYIDILLDAEIEKLLEEHPEQYNRVRHLQSSKFIFITRVNFNADELLTPESFHENFAKRLRFPKYYGENMDAWVDVMVDMMKNELWPMAKCCVVGGGTLDIAIKDSKAFQESPMYNELVDCVKSINEEKVKYQYLRLVFE